MDDQIPLTDNILYDAPTIAAATPKLERALRDMKKLPPTIARQREMESIERELERRREGRPRGG